MRRSTLLIVFPDYIIDFRPSGNLRREEEGEGDVEGRLVEEHRRRRRRKVFDRQGRKNSFRRRSQEEPGVDTIKFSFSVTDVGTK